jgi:hypothetical protein
MRAGKNRAIPPSRGAFRTGNNRAEQDWTYPLFSSGWIAQWKEQHDDPTTKIQRPRQIYTGPTETNYLPIEKR